MNSTHNVISGVIVLILCIVGYFSGLTLGRKEGIKDGIKFGRTQEMQSIRNRLEERTLQIYSRSLDDSTLVFIVEFMRVSDDSSNRVKMKKTTNAQGYITHNKDGIVVQNIHDSGSISIRGQYHYSIWQLMNQTNAPIDIGNSFFENLPPGYDVNQRFHQDPITVNPSEQAAPSNR